MTNSPTDATLEPRLVLLLGLPGAGKTTLASLLAERHAFVVASRDAIRTAMFPDCQFTVQEKQAAYVAMKHAVAIMLSQGKQVVTDGICFSSQSERDEVVALGVTAGAVVSLVACECPIEVAQARVEHDRDVDPRAFADRDAALVVEVASRFDPLPDSAIIVDMTASPMDIGVSVAGHLGLI